MLCTHRQRLTAALKHKRKQRHSQPVVTQHYRFPKGLATWKVLSRFFRHPWIGSLCPRYNEVSEFKISPNSRIAFLLNILLPHFKVIKVSLTPNMSGVIVAINPCCCCHTVATQCHIFYPSRSAACFCYMQLVAELSWQAAKEMSVTVGTLVPNKIGGVLPKYDSQLTLVTIM